MNEPLDRSNITFIRSIAQRQNVLRASAACVERLASARWPEDKQRWAGAKTIFGHLARLSDADRTSLLVSEWKNLHADVRQLLQDANETNSDDRIRERQAKETIAMVDGGPALTLDRETNTIVDEDGKLVAKLGVHAALNLRLSERAASISRRILMGELRTEDVWPSGTAGTQTLPHVEMASAIAAPATPVAHLRGSWFGQVSDDAISQVVPRGATPGGVVSEIDAALSAVSFDTLPYFLGAFVSTDKRQNADFNVDDVSVQRLVETLMLAREVRVSTLLRTSASWTPGNVVTLAAGAKWNGGASADPLENILSVMSASALPPTHMICSPTVARWLFRFISARDFLAMQEAGLLPQLVIAQARVKAAGAPSFVWGGDVVLVRAPRGDADLATCRTLIWNGANDKDRAEAAARLFGNGMLTRVAEKLDRGPRGGQLIVCGSDEVATMLDGAVGGLIVGAVQ